MLKRRIRDNKNKKEHLLSLVGFFLILLSITLVGFKLYKIKSNKLQEDNLKEEFYKQFEEIRNVPKIEFQESEEIVIEKQKEEKKTIKEINYIGLLKIDKIGLEKGLVAKNSPYNNVDINVQILKESDMPDIENGNVILAGHSGNGSTAYFRNLYKLVNDDVISIFYNGYEYKYKVVNIYDIDKTGIAHIIRNASKNTLTLITCRDKTNKQIVVICELIERG